MLLQTFDLLLAYLKIVSIEYMFKNGLELVKNSMQITHVTLASFLCTSS